MNSFQEAQSDLEVILEFLEEYYRQNTGENLEKWHWAAGVAPEERCAAQEWASPCWTPYEQTACKPAAHLQPSPGHAAAAVAPAPGHAAAATPPSDSGPLPKPASTRQLTSKHPATAVGSRRKVRLFHFLFEMLEDPSMAHCVSWVPAAAGVFRFSSRNKDQLAALWGQRKGNKRPMTYQKMSRALRNYARSGEIFKVKKKLTYQFSQDTLTLLYQCRPGALS